MTRKHILFLIIILELWFFPKVSFALTPNEMIIWAHQIETEIIPTKHQLKIKDVFKARFNIEEGRNILIFALNAQLKINSLIYKEKNLRVFLKESLLADEPNTTVYTLPAEILKPIIEKFSGVEKDKKDLIFELAYEGKIYDPLRDPKLFNFSEVKSSRGIISDKGVFLSDKTFWYPVDRNKLLTFFDLEVFIPEPYIAISQGEQVKEETRKNIYYTRWQNTVPASGLTLIASTYQVQTYDDNGTKIFIYLFPEDLQFAPAILKNFSKVLHQYSRLIGTYPYSRYNLVENFFAATYTAPSTAIMNFEMLRMGNAIFQTGYIEQLAAYSWWGNYVFVDKEKGDWAQGLAYYYSKLLKRELESSDEAMRERRQMIQNYSLSINPRFEYAPIQFKGNNQEFEENISQTKIAMFFHLLRKIVGDETFFGTLSKLTKKFGGKILSWEGLEKEFTRGSGDEISTLFTQWIKRKGAPQFNFKNVKKEKISGHYFITGSIIQEGEPYTLRLPIRVKFDYGVKDYQLIISDKTTAINLEVKGEPLKIILDPDYEVFRKIAADKIPMSFNSTLLSPERILVIPSEDEKYLKFAKVLRQLYGIPYYSLSQINPAKLKHNSLIILGGPQENDLAKDYLENLKETLVFSNDGFSFRGRRYIGDAYNLMLSLTHPSDKSLSVTLILNTSPDYFNQLNSLLASRWNSYVVFKDNHAVEKGFLEDEEEMNEGVNF